MRYSVTGARMIQRVQHRNHRGFTLIEILVVLVIASIIATFATLAVNTGLRDRRLSLATDQMLLALRLAQQQAILQSTVFGIVFSPKGYEFYQYHETFDPQSAKWLSLHGDPLLGFRPTSMQVKSMPTSPINADPAIVFYSSGEQSPFLIQLSTQRGNLVQQLKGLENGTITRSQIEKKP